MNAVPVFAGKRKVAAAAIGTLEENLMNGDVAAAKSGGRARHVEQPDAVGLLRDEPQQRGGVLLQPFDPVAQGEFVMLAKIFLVAHLHPLGFRGLKNLRESDQLPVGKDVAVNKEALGVSDEYARVMPWLRKTPPGRRRRRTVLKY